LHHGIGNCVVFDTLEDYYPDGVREFRQMMMRLGIDLPRNLTAGITDAQMEKMVEVALVLEPLWENALGKDWKSIMTREKIRALYLNM
jgi:3-deoxy-alpha-D-manno-octulosonate 8-oxidase